VCVDVCVKIIVICVARTSCISVLCRKEMTCVTVNF
jgi:hypothetical protein